MKGWFDAFRNDGGPTLYNFNNRTSVAGDITLITILTLFCTLYIAFLIILPGIRKEKFTTFFAVTLSLFVGATIFVAMYGSNWHVGHANITSTYRAFSGEKVKATLGVSVGLSHANVTLQGQTIANSSEDINFNEQFVWGTSDQMRVTFRDAIRRGLPYPILTVAEYLSFAGEGLSWGVQYRASGYFASIMLWASLSSWLLMNLMVVAVPRYGALLMTFCGILLLSTACGYFAMLPQAPLVIHLEGSAIDFSLGWCFWLVFTAGCICLFAGVVITVVEIIFPHSFATILEVNYDTPYDRHVIIEDSHGRRFQKKRASNVSKLEEQSGIGTKILRRFSLKTRNDSDFERQPGTPWRYPYSIPQAFPRKQSFLSDSVASSIVSSTMTPIQNNVSRSNMRHEESGMW